MELEGTGAGGRNRQTIEVSKRVNRFVSLHNLRTPLGSAHICKLQKAATGQNLSRIFSQPQQPLGSATSLLSEFL